MQVALAFIIHQGAVLMFLNKSKLKKKKTRTTTD